MGSSSAWAICGHARSFGHRFQVLSARSRRPGWGNFTFRPRSGAAAAQPECPFHQEVIEQGALGGDVITPLCCQRDKTFLCVAWYATLTRVIRSFRHKGLRDLFMTGKSAGVRPDLQKRTLRLLDALHRAQRLSELNLPGYRPHPLHGTPKRYALAVNGPWRVTFEWIDGDAWRVDLEQYH